MRFSERYGYKPIREIVQIESIDEPLRNAIWSLLKLHVWDYVNGGVNGIFLLSSPKNRHIRDLCQRLWFGYFKRPLDHLGNEWEFVLSELRAYFFGCAWYEAFDFVEFVAKNYQRYEFKQSFIEQCNRSLERELSAYRFVGDVISPISDHQETEEIERALENARGPAHTHLSRAIELLSDRENPDYRNSVKESISAVEGLVAAVIGEKGSLGQLIKRLEDEIGLHPALRLAFSNLYGYTSDAGGIRHALLEKEVVDFEDAKFFLVVCSAFINFVEGKRARPGGND